MQGISKGLSAAAALALAAPDGRAGAEDFDYYLLALTWTPGWCATEGGAGEAQCDPARGLGFTLHGLWPQYEDGWPEYCDAVAADPSRRQTAAMADVMGSDGLAWYEWKKHGRCSGLSADAYFALARRAYRGLRLPVPDDGRASAREIAAAFLRANPALAPEDLIVTCDDGRLEEVRICLTPELTPRPCGSDVARDACRSRADLSVPRVPR